MLELGGVYEAFGAFEGALSIYQRIASSMAPSPGFEDVLFRCAVVMRYMASLEVRNMFLRCAVIMRCIASLEAQNTFFRYGVVMRYMASLQAQHLFSAILQSYRTWLL